MVVAPGAYDCITARLIEQAGFAAVYMTGAGTAAALGYPDYGLVTMSEMAANVGRMAAALSVPLIADADTGYGNELNVTRTVREYAARGAAALHIEDQVFPKRCGHLDDKAVIGAAEFGAKIAAAVAARPDPDLIIIARTDARATAGLDDAVDRANRALDEGADMAFVEAPTSLDELAAVPSRVRGPCLVNLVTGGRTPRISTGTAAEMGYRLAIFPTLLLATTVVESDRVLGALAGSGTDPGPELPVAELFRRFGSDGWDALARRADGVSRESSG